MYQLSTSKPQQHNLHASTHQIIHMLTIMLSATRRIEQISSNIASHAFIQTRGVHHKQHKLLTTIMHTKSTTNHGSVHEQHNSSSTDINHIQSTSNPITIYMNTINTSKNTQIHRSIIIIH